MTFELGVYSFGNTPRNADGTLGSTAQAVRDLMEAIHLADEVGVDFFGVGEHHTAELPISSPAAIINAAAASTTRIGLGSTVSVLSTDDPIRVYQQFATASVISGGRVDITVGRGSSTDSFPLFGFRLDDYDALFAAKLELLLAANEHERVTWSGPFRTPLDDALVVPRPDEPLKIWLGTGGNPESSIRAGYLGLPIAYGILGGTAPHWVQLVDLYRRAAEAGGRERAALDVSVATHGFIGPDDRGAKDLFYRHESAMFAAGARSRGFEVPSRAHFDANYAAGGLTFVGGPAEIADRLLAFHAELGHSRQIIQMDVGGMPQEHVLRSIELLGTEVLPRVRAELG
jgi:probable LLM family oxidoreductase